MLQLSVYRIISFAHPSGCCVFNSNNSSVRNIIENCRSNIPDERHDHSLLLRCILDNAPSRYSAHWSAAASILVFVPTIVGLMSNNIDELVIAVEELTLLAAIHSLPAVTSFISRIGGVGSQRVRATLFSQTIWDDATVRSYGNIVQKLVTSWENTGLLSS
ncbi:hypothetical protein EV356DRAFT_508242 [Viridothelium virens]|uniref:Uncharacterized protein n=1 Tax=Viridothelium virens TaxID=1048519 RepID=A0A6A6GZN1_VIRVR|nr:hypothetical protein EV356DRAFT_508242 [Viridothelium virens]